MTDLHVQDNFVLASYVIGGYLEPGYSLHAAGVALFAFRSEAIIHRTILRDATTSRHHSTPPLHFSHNIQTVPLEFITNMQ